MSSHSVSEFHFSAIDQELRTIAPLGARSHEGAMFGFLPNLLVKAGIPMRRQIAAQCMAFDYLTERPTLQIPFLLSMSTPV